MKKNVTRLAIMGGTFDPIHLGHLVTAEAVRDEFNIDEVLFIPTGRPPHKSNVNMTTGKHRYLMTVLATAENPYFKVSRMEIDRTGATYTVDTIQEVRKRYGKETQIYFITGADAMLQILSWKDSDKLLTLCEFVAVTRPGYNKEDLIKQVEGIREKYNTKIHFLEVPALAISSSDIRRRLNELKPIKYLVPLEVENYIKKHDLYNYKFNLTEQQRNEMTKYVASKISAKRYAHTKGVVETALEYAKLNDVDCNEAYIAALFHDVAKELPKEESLALCEKYHIDIDEFEREHIDLAHGKIGAAILQRDFKIDNPNILNAIRNHTLGRKNMSDLEMVIFLADMTEEGRPPFKDREEIKQAATSNLKRAMYKAFLSTYNYVVKTQKKEPHPIIIELLDYYKQYDDID